MQSSAARGTAFSAYPSRRSLSSHNAKTNEPGLRETNGRLVCACDTIFPSRLRQLSSHLFKYLKRCSTGWCSRSLSRNNLRTKFLLPDLRGPIHIKSRKFRSISSYSAQINGPNLCGLIMTMNTSPQYRSYSLQLCLIVLIHIGTFKF
jgi:hypothetical protein